MIAPVDQNVAVGNYEGRVVQCLAAVHRHFMATKDATIFPENGYVKCVFIVARCTD